jgi:hypothetical protein
VIGIEQHAAGGDDRACALQERHQVALVSRLVRRLQRHDRIEHAEAVGPAGVSEVARHERHPTRERTQMLGGDLVHGRREVERDIGVHVAMNKHLASELARPGAKLEDAEPRACGERRAERVEEARPIRALDSRLLDPPACGRRIAKVDPDRQVLIMVAGHVHGRCTASPNASSGGCL